MKKKVVIIISIVATLLLTIGVTFAVYTYTESGTSQDLVVGDIYMKYAETNQLTLTDAMPGDDYSDYFQFSVSGKNTYEKKDIWYDIKLIKGDVPDGKSESNRIEDKYLKFKLVEVNNDVETVLFENKTYRDLTDKAVYVSTIPKESENYSKTYRLYMTISSDLTVGNTDGTISMEEFENLFGSIKIKVTGDFNEKEIYNSTSNILKSINNKKTNNTSCSNITIEENGTTYLSGTNNCIDFNYVWYSGKLWRITSINSDGSFKMITNNPITTISFNPGNNTNFYTDENNKSFVYQWLNEDFLSTLYNYENIINTSANWYSLETTDVATKINSTVNDVITYTNPVGLLNSYEYYLSYRNATSSTGFLVPKYNYFLLNPYSSSKIWDAYPGEVLNAIPNHGSGISPVITVKAEVSFYSGTGTKTDPYKFEEDKSDAVFNKTLLNTRSSGEYVKFDGNLYRIVSIDNNKTKLTKIDYLKDESNSVIKKKLASTIVFGATGNEQNDDYFDYYLNNTWYNSISINYKNMMTTGTYYIGAALSNENYKKTICAEVNNTTLTSNCNKVSSTFTGYVGMPRIGEMFASQQGNSIGTSSYFWTLTPVEFETGSSMYYITLDSFAQAGGSSIAARPSINLKSGVKIIGGTGLKEDPYEISL